MEYQMKNLFIFSITLFFLSCDFLKSPEVDDKSREESYINSYNEIEGIVIDKDTENPLQNIPIVLKPPQNLPDDLKGTFPQYYTNYTDINGEFYFWNIPSSYITRVIYRGEVVSSYEQFFGPFQLIVNTNTASLDSNPQYFVDYIGIENLRSSYYTVIRLQKL